MKVTYLLVTSLILGAPAFGAMAGDTDDAGASSEAGPATESKPDPEHDATVPAAAEEPRDVDVSFDDLDFDLFEAEPADAPVPVSQATLDEVGSRRLLLNSHQIGGFATLLSMVATVVLGQLNVADLYSAGGKRTGDYRMAHRIASYSSLGVFTATGTLALLAPNPYDKPVEAGFNPAYVHRVAAIVATVGMASQLGLGFVTARRADAGNPNSLGSLATAHQVIGFGTLASLLIAGSAWLF